MSGNIGPLFGFEKDKVIPASDTVVNHTGSETFDTLLGIKHLVRSSKFGRQSVDSDGYESDIVAVLSLSLSFSRTGTGTMPYLGCDSRIRIHTGTNNRLDFTVETNTAETKVSEMVLELIMVA
jgi:hypothetical protein